MGALNAAYSDETTIHIRDEDTLPRRRWTILDRQEERIDLSAADEVRFRMADRREVSTTVIDDPMTIDAPEDGVVSYQFSGLIADTPGEYAAELVVVWPNGQQRTAPSTGCIPVTIEGGYVGIAPQTGFGSSFGDDFGHPQEGGEPTGFGSDYGFDY